MFFSHLYYYSPLLMCGIGAFTFGILIYMNGESLLSLMSDDPEVIMYGMYRLRYVSIFLFINGLLDIVVNSIRGMGLSLIPTIVTLFGVCGFRILYISTYFERYHTPESLYRCFPLSWTITFFIQSVIWIIVYRRLIRKEAESL